MSRRNRIRPILAAILVALPGSACRITIPGGRNDGQASGPDARPDARLDAAPDAGPVPDAAVIADSGTDALTPPPCTNDCVEQVYIPAGTFLMGAQSVPGESLPQHTVTLTRGFWVDRYEVSESRYAVCLNASVCPQPEASFGGTERAVRGITWEAANLYCTWAGKRLPTEAEWERAACGDGVQCYPWGGDKIDWDCTDHPDCSMAAFCPESLCAGGPCYDRPQEVTAFEIANVSPFGVVNMGGNVWEWVLDTWTPSFDWCSPSCIDPLAPQSSPDHVMKGGSWISEEVFLRCAARYHDGAGGFPAFEVGIRCVQDPQ